MTLDSAAFVKMHGLGNDFVFLDLRDADAAALEAARKPAVARALADRRRGVGCDQVIVIEPSAEADLGLRFLNSDGSESGACGNGTRCAGALLMAPEQNRITFATGGGVLRCDRMPDGRIRVDMGPPRFDWRDVPLAYEAPTDDLRAALGSLLEELGGVAPVQIGAASMGNPHCILVVNDMAQTDVERVGAALERHPIFPERANIGFVQALAPDRLRYRVFERGAGVTEACGSGACAALAVAARLGVSGAAARIELDGGALDVEQSAETGHILMTGPTARVFDGRLSAQMLAAVAEAADG